MTKPGPRKHPCRGCILRRNCEFHGQHTPSPREPRESHRSWRSCIFYRCPDGTGAAKTAIRNAAMGPSEAKGEVEQLMWQKRHVEGEGETFVLPAVTDKKTGFVTPRGRLLIEREGKLHLTGQRLGSFAMAQLEHHVRRGLRNSGASEEEIERSLQSK